MKWVLSILSIARQQTEELYAKVSDSIDKVVAEQKTWKEAIVTSKESSQKFENNASKYG